MSLASKLSEVMTAVGYIPKTGRNQAQNYDFVTDADVLDKIRTELAKRNIAVATSVTDVETLPFETGKGAKMFLVTVKGDVTFYDGENPEDAISIEGAGQGSDSTDKGIYKAITGMVKYALLKTFLVPTGDDPERDDERPTKSGEDVKVATTSSPTDRILSTAQVGMLKGKLIAAGFTSNQMALLGVSLVGKGKAKEMTTSEMDKILAYIEDPENVAKAKTDFAE